MKANHNINFSIDLYIQKRIDCGELRLPANILQETLLDYLSTSFEPTAIRYQLYLLTDNYIRENKTNEQKS